MSVMCNCGVRVFEIAAVTFLLEAIAFWISVDRY